VVVTSPRIRESHDNGSISLGQGPGRRELMQFCEPTEPRAAVSTSQPSGHDTIEAAAPLGGAEPGRPRDKGRNRDKAGGIKSVRWITENVDRGGGGRGQGPLKEDGEEMVMVAAEEEEKTRGGGGEEVG
jgi:hypothetical protein